MFVLSYNDFSGDDTVNEHKQNDVIFPYFIAQRVNLEQLHVS
jgi:hypothetical protein